MRNGDAPYGESWLALAGVCFTRGDAHNICVVSPLSLARAAPHNCLLGQPLPCAVRQFLCCTFFSLQTGSYALPPLRCALSIARWQMPREPSVFVTLMPGTVWITALSPACCWQLSDGVAVGGSRTVTHGVSGHCSAQSCHVEHDTCKFSRRLLSHSTFSANRNQPRAKPPMVAQMRSVCRSHSADSHVIPVT